MIESMDWAEAKAFLLAKPGSMLERVDIGSRVGFYWRFTGKQFQTRFPDDARWSEGSGDFERDSVMPTLRTARYERIEW